MSKSTAPSSLDAEDTPSPGPGHLPDDDLVLTDLPEPAAGPGHGTFTLLGQTVQARRLETGLHVVATPIGNLGDITVRALETLAGAGLIACEDTRMTRRLTERYGITTHLVPYHDHNGAAMRPKLLARLAAGDAVALVSDAGTPLVSDPGYKLVVE
ncbi:MAG: hypothetical protein B7Y75_05360, partial [Azorhizobium sp. 35-67-5]